VAPARSGEQIEHRRYEPAIHTGPWGSPAFIGEIHYADRGGGGGAAGCHRQQPAPGQLNPDSDGIRRRARPSPPEDWTGYREAADQAGKRA
jgi:hypothetical protein